MTNKYIYIILVLTGVFFAPVFTFARPTTSDAIHMPDVFLMGTLSTPNSIEIYSSSLYPTSTLKAYYRLEGNGYDTTGNNHFATGTNSSYISGKFGQALSLSGNGYMTIADHIDFKPTSTSFTVTGWFKTPSDTNMKDIIQSYNYSSGGKGWEIGFKPCNINSHKLGIVIENGSTANCSNSTTNYDNDSWHFFAITYNSTDSHTAIYVDGGTDENNKVSGSWTAPTYYATNYVQIGDEYTDLGGRGKYFSGSIDDLTFFNRLLTTVEINDIYDHQVSAPATTTPSVKRSVDSNLWITLGLIFLMSFVVIKIS